MNSKFCLCCDSHKIDFLFSLGSMPPVNAFTCKDEKFESYPLDLFFCSNCYLIQLGNIVSPDKLFSNYYHTSSASVGNIKHLNDVVEILQNKFLINSKRILEIGSNDGLLLSLMQKSGGNVLGVDPAENLLEEVHAKGVSSLVGFFDENFAINMDEKYSKFDTIIALNVMAHTPTFLSALKGIRRLLDKKGIFMMENAYVIDTILQGQFDTIYHEHIFCFSLHSLMFAYNLAGLEAFDADIIPTQGTSIRVFVQKKGAGNKPSKRLNEILHREKNIGIQDIDKFKAAADDIVNFKYTFKEYVKNNRSKGKFVGLGAPARGVVILNYCGVTSDDIEFIIDDTKLKQEKFIPGIPIPVKNWDALKPLEHHNFILLSWNYAENFLDKLRSMSITGTVLVPFPNFREVIL